MSNPIELPEGAKLDTYYNDGDGTSWVTYSLPEGLVTVYGATLKHPPRCARQQPREHSTLCRTCNRTTWRVDAYCHRHSPIEGAGMDRTLTGRRVELISTTDPHTHLTPGSKGTVQFRDDAGTLSIRWDDGSSLGLVAGEDHWKLYD